MERNHGNKNIKKKRKERTNEQHSTRILIPLNCTNLNVDGNHFNIYFSGFFFVSFHFVFVLLFDSFFFLHQKKKSNNWNIRIEKSANSCWLFEQFSNFFFLKNWMSIMSAMSTCQCLSYFFFYSNDNISSKRQTATGLNKNFRILQFFLFFSRFFFVYCFIFLSRFFWM